MFDLEKAIKDWKREFFRQDVFEEALVADLELQLRDSFEEIKGEIPDEAAAFREAASRMGDPEAIAAEYRKNRAVALDRRRPLRPSRFLPALGLSYFKTAWRKMKRQKGYALINIASLAVGLAGALFIWLWVQDELSFDKFHANAPALFRVEQDQTGGQGKFHVYVTQYPMGPAIQAAIPEIKSTVRQSGTGGLLIRNGDKVFVENRVRAVDPAFLKAFTFPLVRGDGESALKNPGSILLTEEMAVKYFGAEDPVGKTLVVNNAHSLAVTGVLKKTPANSTIGFDMLVPFEFLRSLGVRIDAWGSNNIITWVELQDPAAAKAVGEKITQFMTETFYASVRDNPQALAEARKRRLPEFMLMPLTDLRLKAVFGFGQVTGTIQSVKSFSVIALLVLLIACINFMNLATARSASRAKEVGLRKVVGRPAGPIIAQFYGESILTAFLAAPLPSSWSPLLLPAFNTLSGKSMALSAFLSPEISSLGSWASPCPDRDRRRKLSGPLSLLLPARHHSPGLERRRRRSPLLRKILVTFSSSGCPSPCDRHGRRLPPGRLHADEIARLRQGAADLPAAAR